MLALDQLSVNPLAYWMKGTSTSRSVEVVLNAFADCRRAGFTRVKADVFDGWTPADYSAVLVDLGLKPGLSMFMSALDRSASVDAECERARRFAQDQMALGLDATMICAIFVPERTRTPAIGANFEPGRLDRVIQDLASIAETLTNEGLRPLLHPHVGGWIETENEVERVLDDIPERVLGFGPDTGHLAWAGMDPAAMVARHAQRVGALHIKDLRSTAFVAIGADYEEITMSKLVWAEPGTGVVDFESTFASLPQGFSGECVIEVDVPTTTPYESLEQSRAWATRYFS